MGGNKIVYVALPRGLYNWIALYVNSDLRKIPFQRFHGIARHGCTDVAPIPSVISFSLVTSAESSPPALFTLLTAVEYIIDISDNKRNAKDWGIKREH